MENTSNNETRETFKKYQYRKVIMVLNGAVVGVIAGFITIVYRLLISKTEWAMKSFISFFSKSPLGIVCWFAVLAVITFIVGKIIKWEPDISGSGIPQVEAEITGHLDQKWWRVILAKIAGGALCILAGLSLGREGPSIQLGGMAGKGYARLTKKTHYEEKYIITCGASAGLSAAFNAPLAGVMFALEEVHKHFSVSVLLSAMSASIIADFMSAKIFGLSPVFSFTVAGNIPLKYYGLLVFLGVLLGLFGALYNKSIPFLQGLFDKMKKLPPQYRVAVPIFMAGIFAFTLPQLLGSGHYMIELLHEGTLVFKSVLLLLMLKFVFSTVSFTSSAPGGIFFPLLVLGAYLGCAYGLFSIKLFGIDEALLNNFIILAMAGFFAAVVRAPLTGIILLCEMTGTFSQFLSVSVVAMCAYITVEVLKVEPVYDQLLKRMLGRKNVEHAPLKTNKKCLFEAAVHRNSEFDGRTLREMDIPRYCLIIAVRRNGEEMIPNGDTLIMANDAVVVWTEKSTLTKAHHYFNDRCRDKQFRE